VRKIHYRHRIFARCGNELVHQLDGICRHAMGAWGPNNHNEYDSCCRQEQRRDGGMFTIFSEMSASTDTSVLMFHNSHLLFLSFSVNKANDLDFCQGLASQVSNAKDLPAKCQYFPSVVDSVKRKSPASSQDSMDIAFQGMRPGSAIQARRSRAMGYEHSAKLNRRLTSTGRDHHYQPQAAK
jgi:hypothetical protein